MVPARVPKSQRTPIPANASSGEEETSQSGSQGSEEDKEDKVSKMGEQMMKEMRARREKRRTDIRNAHKDSMRKIEDAMYLKLDEISRRMTHRHKLRMERLCDLIQRRTAMEANMLATSKKIESAFMFADQALEFATGRRLQTFEGHEKTSAA